MIAETIKKKRYGWIGQPLSERLPPPSLAIRAQNETSKRKKTWETMNNLDKDVRDA